MLFLPFLVFFVLFVLIVRTIILTIIIGEWSAAFVAISLAVFVIISMRILINAQQLLF
jgi:hypothetical protein